MSLGYQSFYQTQLTSNIDDTVLTIPVDTAPIPDEGYLVIESTVSAKREIIWYTSKTASSVICPPGGRGYDGTTAVSHLQGAAVIMAPVAAMFEALTDLFTTTPQGWTSMTQNITTVTANGNRSYTLDFDGSVASTLSSGMRLRTTRTVAAPTTCFSLDGVNDFYNDTSVAGMTFTDDFTVGRWIYLTSYAAASIMSRYNGTSGWDFRLESDGRVTLGGYNAGAGNTRLVRSYQSVPLNKWVFVSAHLDMSGYTYTSDAGATNSYIGLDGTVIPGVMAQAGTNPTALIQAGNLEIGSSNGGTLPFPGRIGGGFISSARITAANIRTLIGQELTASDVSTHSMVSAWASGSTTDLNTTNANNLTAQNGATTANYSPFGNNGTSSTLDYALVMSVSGSTATVQVPEGCTIPTSGGVTSVSYSVQGNPYGWVSDKGRWEVGSNVKAIYSISGAPVAGTFYRSYLDINVPVGAWTLGYQVTENHSSNTTATCDIVFELSTSTSASTDLELSFWDYRATTTVNVFHISTQYRSKQVSLTAATQYYGIAKATVAGNNSLALRGDVGTCRTFAIPAGI